MKREDQIIEAAKPYADEPLRYLGFMDGATWTDRHPNWINVKDYATDELPPLIDEKDPYGESVQVLFVVVLDGVQYINKGTYDYDTGVWHSLDMQCSFCKDDVTHWMHMPELPICGKTSPIEEGGKK